MPFIAPWIAPSVPGLGRHVGRLATPRSLRLSILWPMRRGSCKLYASHGAGMPPSYKRDSPCNWRSKYQRKHIIVASVHPHIDAAGLGGQPMLQIGFTTR